MMTKQEAYQRAFAEGQQAFITFETNPYHKGGNCWHGFENGMTAAGEDADKARLLKAFTKGKRHGMWGVSSSAHNFFKTQEEVREYKRGYDEGVRTRKKNRARDKAAREASEPRYSDLHLIANTD